MNMPTERSDGGSRQGHHMREAHVAEAREIVRDKLPASEILAQMAEECAELAKAALKLRRVLTGDNPTTVSYGMATENVLEECGDVLCCAQLFLRQDEVYQVRDICSSKTIRWAERLQERDGENETE